MDLDLDFTFKPLPPIDEPEDVGLAAPEHPLGPLKDLPGLWEGHGFNQIWRPFRDTAKLGASGPNPPPNQDRFLELNLTQEKIRFDLIPGKIPNRGLLQKDLNMFGLHYLQQIKDANVGAGLHVEPGIWLKVPPTADPDVPRTVCRMASIPHGTTVVAQGTAIPDAPLPLQFDPADITPFVIGTPTKLIPFPESNLSTPSAFRSSGQQMNNITQAMVNNPNAVLAAALQGQTIKHMMVLKISSAATAPQTGGGTDNTSFLAGSGDGPNAQGAQVDATFWIQTVEEAGQVFLQLQYTQRVLLNFNGLSWPHISVGTLRQVERTPYSVHDIDPDMPDAVRRQIPGET